MLTVKLADMVTINDALGMFAIGVVLLFIYWLILMHRIDEIERKIDTIDTAVSRRAVDVHYAPGPTFGTAHVSALRGYQDRKAWEEHQKPGKQGGTVAP